MNYIELKGHDILREDDQWKSHAMGWITVHNDLIGKTVQQVRNQHPNCFRRHRRPIMNTPSPNAEEIQKKISEAKTHISVMEAYLRGEPIEFREKGQQKWESQDSRRLAFIFEENEYRIKPKTIEMTVAGNRTMIEKSGAQVGCTWVNATEIVAVYNALMELR